MLNTLHNSSTLVDTGFWVALGNKNDKHHARALQAFTDNTDVLITTSAVITETTYLLYRDAGFDKQQAFLHGLEMGITRIFDLQQQHFGRVQALMRQYANLPMDLADASLVILAEELGHGRIFSTDQRDFGTYRWKQHKPFHNLLLP
ncbi:type II toxin-antitoxin system VapC family toxin [Thiothrix winogradskyi]|uniref:PIN domain-containing protein n=1 Tax=Thiothrix winogradskyi TaxID=96472 RepID=A0ABY3T058_9GAMM|nr:PIN domain-containing protein [Thiothrix winogradskyi]UJS24395.1 PIN domain-containing protein [Thiothrix winogradskyi]